MDILKSQHFLFSDHCLINYALFVKTPSDFKISKTCKLDPLPGKLFSQRIHSTLFRNRFSEFINTDYDNSESIVPFSSNILQYSAKCLVWITLWFEKPKLWNLGAPLAGLNVKKKNQKFKNFLLYSYNVLEALYQNWKNPWPLGQGIGF